MLGFAASAGENDKREKEQKRQVTGKITDLSGEAVAGARILIAETGESFYADLDGNFSISFKTDKEYTIQVQGLGFVPANFKSHQVFNFSDLVLKSL